MHTLKRAQGNHLQNSFREPSVAQLYVICVTVAYVLKVSAGGRPAKDRIVLLVLAMIYREPYRVDQLRLHNVVICVYTHMYGVGVAPDKMICDLVHDTTCINGVIAFETQVATQMHVIAL